MRGRLDAVLIAARVAPTTRHIGFVPTAIVTHTEPFHLSKAIATLDYVSSGRAGLRVQIAGRDDAIAHFGRRTGLSISARQARRSGRPATRSRPLRRGGRLRRSRAAAVGQLGGRRRDPRRRHRPVHRSRQAALHRLRGSLVQRQGPVDHAAAAAGPADRRRAGPRVGAVSADRAARPTSASSRRAMPPTRRDRRQDPGRTTRGRSGRRVRPRLRRSGRLPRRHRIGSPANGATASTSSPAPRTSATPRSSPAPRPSWPTCCSSGRQAGLSGFRLRPADAAARPDPDHPRPGAGTAAPQRIPPGLPD